MCVMRLMGPYREIASSVGNAFVEFQEADASRKEREGGAKKGRAEATFNYTLSEAPGDCVPIQVDEAIRFLAEHQDEISELRSRPGVEHAVLDFMWEFPVDGNGQWNRFPLALVDLCAQLGLEIEVSVYPCDFAEEAE